MIKDKFKLFYKIPHEYEVEKIEYSLTMVIIDKIQSFWLRERVENKEFLDEITQQRLFDPAFTDQYFYREGKIENDELEINFNDGVKSYLSKHIINEYSNQKMVMSSIEKLNGTLT